MKGKQSTEDSKRLESLYRESGDVEPDAGLDWRVRARARRQASRSGLPRPAQWLGGLAVAASLFVVVVVVQQMEPPQGGFPETAPQRIGEPVSDSDRTELRAPTETAERMGSPASRERASEAFAPSAPPPAPGRTTPSEEGERAVQQLLDEERGRLVERLAEDRAPLDPELGFSESGSLDSASPANDAQRRIWLIDQLIATEQAALAREQLEALRRQYPEQDIPAALIERLQQLEEAVENSR